MLIKESLTDRIYEILKDMILTGRLKKNEKINIDKLAKDIGTSKIPIREAIARLHQDGVLIYKTNVGARVADIDHIDAREIIDVLNKLTGLDIDIGNITSREEINKLIDKYQEASGRTGSKRLYNMVEKLCAQLRIWM